MAAQRLSTGTGDGVIVVDWGTTNFRAWLLAANGDLIDEIETGRGMSALATDEFPAYCTECLANWRNGPAPPAVYMAGMVGAAHGWQQAPQPPLPISLDDLASGVVAARGVEDAWIVPGVRQDTDPPDVMRGEEVQIFGALTTGDQRDALLCLPGTHSKWARVVDGALVEFTTSMTGEVYAVMLEHSILGRALEYEAAPATPAFEMGLAQSHAKGGLLHHLFSARTRRLDGGLRSYEVPDYLSGLLIGSEVGAMVDAYPPDLGELILVCSLALRDPYQRALRRAGYRFRWVDSAVATRHGVRDLILRRRALAARPTETGR